MHIPTKLGDFGLLDIAAVPEFQWTVMLFIPQNAFLKERQAKKSHAYESERVPENVLVCCQRENAHSADLSC